MGEEVHRFLWRPIPALLGWAGAIPDGGTTEGLINIEKNRVDYEGPSVARCSATLPYIPVGSKRISAQYDFEQGYMGLAINMGQRLHGCSINPADHEEYFVGS